VPKKDAKAGKRTANSARAKEASHAARRLSRRPIITDIGSYSRRPS